MIKYSACVLAHKQRQAKQARETCFSMLITTVCLLLKAYCILTLTLILIAGIRLRFIAILHNPILYHWQQLQIGFIVLERQQQQAKNGTEWSFDADYYCLFIQHLHNAYACLLPLSDAIAIQQFSIPLSLYPLPTIWQHIFHKILYTAILLHSLHYYARKRPILGLQEKVSPGTPSKRIGFLACVTWFIHLPVRVASLRCLRLSHNIYRSKADFGCRQSWVYIININTKELGLLLDMGVQRKSLGYRV